MYFVRGACKLNESDSMWETGTKEAFRLMKKLICALAKLVAALAVVSALLYAAVLYWDKIMAVVAKLKTMLPDALKVRTEDDAEAEDYADWEL